VTPTRGDGSGRESPPRMGPGRDEESSSAPSTSSRTRLVLGWSHLRPRRGLARLGGAQDSGLPPPEREDLRWVHHRVLNDAGDIRRGPRAPHARRGQHQEPHDQSRQHVPWPGTHAAVRPATPEGGHRRKALNDKESTRWGLHLRMIGDLLSRGSHQSVYSVKCTMMSILFQPNDLLHTDRSIAVLLAQTMSGQIDVLNATNIRKIARGSIDDQGFSSVPPSTRAWHLNHQIWLRAQTGHRHFW
jgi:hypothetical protein